MIQSEVASLHYAIDCLVNKTVQNVLFLLIAYVWACMQSAAAHKRPPCSRLCTVCSGVGINESQ